MALALGYDIYHIAWPLICFSLPSIIWIAMFLLFDFVKSQRADLLVTDGQTYLAHTQEVLKLMSQDERELISRLDPTYFSKVEEISFLSVCKHLLYSSCL